MDCYLIPLGIMLSLVSGVPDTDYCEYPTEFAHSGWRDTMFMIGTVVKYQCDEGFEGLHEDTVSYECFNYSKKVDWKDNNNCCIKEMLITNTHSGCLKMVNVDSLTSEERTWTEFCGPPPDVRNATIHFAHIQFPLGQELIYNLNGTDHTKNGEHGVLKCMDCNGSSMWVNLTDGCPNTCSPKKTDIIQTQEETGYSSNKTDTKQRQEKSVIPYIIISTVLIIMVMSLVIYGIQLWKERSARKSRTLTKSTKSGCEEENERQTIVIHDSRK